MRSSLILSLALVAVAACRPQITYDYAKEPDPRKGGYVIGANDLLQIDVWKNQDLSGRHHVRPDGSITMPIIGDVQAAGVTPGQLREVLGRKLSRFLRDDSTVITVTVIEVNSYRINVVGKVERPGVYTPKDFVTILDALALAGGASKFADTDSIIIIRRDRDGTQRKIPFFYSEVVAGRHLEMNMTLLGGDTVVVP
ncbi:MAG TPA: polysaccharide biosynthesis/export family protein [Polyangia bacterium]|jgi:polysaccharide export outer membrane protein